MHITDHQAFRCFEKLCLKRAYLLWKIKLDFIYGWFPNTLTKVFLKFELIPMLLLHR